MKNDFKRINWDTSYAEARWNVPTPKGHISITRNSIILPRFVMKKHKDKNYIELYEKEEKILLKLLKNKTDMSLKIHKNMYKGKHYSGTVSSSNLLKVLRGGKYYKQRVFIDYEETKDGVIIELP